MGKTGLILAVLLLAFMVVVVNCGGGGGGGGSDGTGGSGSTTLSTAKAITAFSFTSPVASGTIDENWKTIAVTVPYGTDVSALVATFTSTGISVMVGSTVQVSGTTPNNFTGPLTYTVTAADGTTATYSVTVTVAAALAKAKAIIAFSITIPAATGIVDESAKTIAVTVPYGTNITALVAAFTTTGVSVKVGGTGQVSGTTPNNITNPVAYVVSAADGSSVTYTVSVTIAPGGKAASEIIVANSLDYVISVFSANASGNINALRQFGSLTGMSTPQGIAVDTVNNQIFVANYNNDSITVYGRTDAGNIAPVRTISGANTGLSRPRGIAVDTVNNEIFVTNENYSITVYGRTDAGNIAPVRTISGANTGLNFPNGVAVDTNQIFVANFNSNSITVYGRTDTGNIAPVRTITGASTGLSRPNGIAVDTVNNQIIVTNNFNNSSYSITVYGRTDTGNIAPVRTISGASTGLFDTRGIAVDTVHNEIFVTNGYGGLNSITVYSRTANGNIAPLRTISGVNTDLSSANGIAVDTVNNQIFVANFRNSITVYGRTDTGNIAPVRAISGAGTGLINPRGIAVDTVNNEIFVTNFENNANNIISQITVYGRTDTGNIAPLRTISGLYTNLNCNGIAVDPFNNEIFVTNDSYITVYGRTGSGNIWPVRTISGANTGLSRPQGIAVDPYHSQLFVANTDNNSITVYGRTDTGNIAPVRTISGSNTLLNSPSFIALDTVNNQIFVTNWNNSITVYGSTDSGNITPVRTILGANTGLNFPNGIAVDTVNNQIFVANYNNDSITVYGRTDTGNIVPVRTISGANTGWSGAWGIALY